MKLNIIKLLSGGDKRSIGNVERIVKIVNKNPEYLDVLFQSILLNDELIRMRAMDAIEKISQQNKQCLGPYKKFILNKVAFYDQQEVKWHVAQIVSRLTLTDEERRKVYDLLIDRYLVDKSSIVKTSAMQALVELSLNDKTLKKKVAKIIKQLVRTGTPAMKARGKKLLLMLDNVATFRILVANRSPNQQ